ncbi:MAG TPA: FixH family protein [Beijerinckiaceae bacterium]
MSTAITRESPGFVLTGRKVLLAFVLFFGTIASADGFLLWSAVRTWSGAETTSAYKAGQLYNGELSQARAQAARGWRLDMTVERAPGGGAAVRVVGQDADGAALANKKIAAVLQRPTDKRADRSVDLAEGPRGAYAGEIARIAPGQWDLVVDVSKDGALAYRRKIRVVLR